MWAHRKACLCDKLIDLFALDKGDLLAGAFSIAIVGTAVAPELALDDGLYCRHNLNLCSLLWSDKDVLDSAYVSAPPNAAAERPHADVLLLAIYVSRSAPAICYVTTCGYARTPAFVGDDPRQQ